MAIETVVAAVAGATAAAHYLDAKFHLREDLDALWRQHRGAKIYRKAVREDRVSMWYPFVEASHRYPDELAIWSRMGSLTWRETYNKACQYAQYMISLGVRPGDLVAVYLINSPEIMIVWLATFAIGCAPAMINYNITGDALIHCLKISEAKVLIGDADEACEKRIDETGRRRIEELGISITILDEAKRKEIETLEPREPDKWRRNGMKGSFPYVLSYTSGTTGFPKASPYTLERNWLLAPQKGDRLNGKPGPGGDRWYVCMPLYHGTGGISSMACLISGTTLAIGRRFSVTNFWKDIHDSEATHFIFVGETARYLLAAPPGPHDRDHKVRLMYGNGMRPDVWVKFQERFNVPEVLEFFNSTEGVFTLANWCRGPFLARCQGHHGLVMRWILQNKFVPVAIDHETGDIWRDPETGFAKRNPYSEGGEMIVKIPSEAAFQGYWNSPEATKKKYAYDVFEKGDLYYRSGDALRRDGDGRWFFMDRLGDTFRWKSENVSTAEVAASLGRYPGVIEANVYGILLPNHDGRAGCAALLVESASAFDFKGLLIHARKELPRYAVPVFIRVINSSVHIHNNKQNKVPLRAEGVDPDLVGTKSIGGEKDRFLWIPPKGDSYLDFRRGEWEIIKRGEITL